MKKLVAATLVASFASLAVSTLAGCAGGDAAATDSNDDDVIVPEGKEDNFYSTSAREYFVSGKGLVTLEAEYDNKTATEKLRRAKELVQLKTLAISWFLNSYLIDKEEDEKNASYGGKGALVKFASETESDPRVKSGRTYEFDYQTQVAGSPSLISRIGGGGKFTLEAGNPSNAEMASLEFNNEWYRSAPWDEWNPKTATPAQKDPIALSIVLQTKTQDAWLAYDRLLADRKITIGVHFGHDYHARGDISGSRDFYNFLLKEGWKSPVSSYEKYLRTSAAITKTITSNGKSIKLELKLYHPGDASQKVPGPDPDTDEGGKLLEADMRESFAKREVIMFLGHSGPLYGFALANWKKTDEGDLDDSKIAGLEMPKDTYQIVLADGCDTYALGQAFFGNPAKADKQNLNVITSTSFSNAGTEAGGRRLVRALSNQTSQKLVPVKVSELTAGLDSDQGYGFTSMFGVHGVDANPKYDPMSDAAYLCQACATNADCGADGNRCTKIKTGLKACTIGCLDDTGCPSNYACRAVASSSTSTLKTKQCVPVGLRCE